MFVAALAPQVTDFASMPGVIGQLCRRGLIVVLDEFQYFTQARLYAFNSFLQEQVDRLRDTQGGGLFVLGSLRSEMSALLDDKVAPLFGRLTATIDLQHWDFEDLIEVYRAHDIRDPHHWLTLRGFFEGVPKFYRDAYDQGLFQVGPRFQEALLERIFPCSRGAPPGRLCASWYQSERKALVALGRLQPVQERRRASTAACRQHHWFPAAQATWDAPDHQAVFDDGLDRSLATQTGE